MSLGMPIGPALEQLREVIAILRELGNAGPRDNSFKQWRQVSVTLLQRIWPSDQAKAARFRRIPFSPPSSRADAKTVRECFERGVCEAIAYLESLIEELETHGQLGRKLVRPAEAPLGEPDIHPDTYGAEPPFAPAEPAPIEQQSRDREVYAVPPPRAAQAPPPPVAPAPPTPAAQAPLPPAEPPAAEAPRPARERTQKNGRSKPRLKDMLGFSDEAPSPPPAASAPPPPAAPAPAAPRPAAPAPAAPQPPRPVAAEAPAVVPPPRPVAPPPQAVEHPAPRPVAPPPPAPAQPRPVETPRASAPADPGRVSFRRFEPPPVPEPEEFEPEYAEELEVEPVEEAPEWTAPVVPFPGHKVVVGRPSPAPVPAPEPVEPGPYDDPEQTYDIDFGLDGDVEIDSEPPPATLREMLDRTPARRPAAPPPAVRELLAMAKSVDDLGVPRERRALVRAALSDLGQQMETSSVDWSAIRQTLAFVLDYPLIARRVLPLLLPYLDEAA